MKKGYIYKITNKINNKCYIGITRDRSVFSRWQEHLRSNNKLSQAITMFGITSFQFEVLEEIESISNYDLTKLETYYIQKYNSIINGYNKRLSHAHRKQEVLTENDLTENVKLGIYALQHLQYLGKGGPKQSFWRSLQNENLCFMELLIPYNYLTNPSSKYYKTLHLCFKLREQKYFGFNIYGEEYYTENIQDIIEILGDIHRNSQFTLLNFESRDFDYKLLLEYNGVQKIVILHKCLFYSDELTYKIECQSIRELFKENDS